MAERILVLELDIAGVSHIGKARIMIRTSEPASNDVELMQSVLFHMPNAIASVSREEIREVSKVQVLQPVKN